MRSTRAAEMARRDGVALVADGKYEEAVKELRRAVELDPTSVGAHRSLGQALSYWAARSPLPTNVNKRDLLAEAKRYVERARELNGGEDTVSILHDLAWIHDEEGDFSGAAELYRRALAAGGSESPENDLTPVRYNLACALAKLGPSAVPEAAAELRTLLQPWRKGDALEWAASDPDLESFRGTEEWRALVRARPRS